MINAQLPLHYSWALYPNLRFFPSSLFPPVQKEATLHSIFLSYSPLPITVSLNPANESTPF